MALPLLPFPSIKNQDQIAITIVRYSIWVNCIRLNMFNWTIMSPYYCLQYFHYHAMTWLNIINIINTCTLINVFFPPSILWCNWGGYHLAINLTKFNYKKVGLESCIEIWWSLKKNWFFLKSCWFVFKKSLNLQ
jgi:hypothetical protein